MTNAEADELMEKTIKSLDKLIRFSEKRQTRKHSLDAKVEQIRATDGLRQARHKLRENLFRVTA